MAQDACEVKPDGNLLRLREITRAIEFSGIVHQKSDQEIIELEMNHGTGYMVGLYKTPAIGVARNYASAGCEFPLHSHEEWELLLVYKGEMRLTVEGKTITLKEKGFHYILPGHQHEAYFPKESWFLAITMPASESWPKGG